MGFWIFKFEMGRRNRFWKMLRKLGEPARKLTPRGGRGPRSNCADSRCKWFPKKIGNSTLKSATKEFTKKSGVNLGKERR